VDILWSEFAVLKLCQQLRHSLSVETRQRRSPTVVKMSEETSKLDNGVDDIEDWDPVFASVHEDHRPLLDGEHELLHKRRKCRYGLCRRYLWSLVAIKLQPLFIIYLYLHLFTACILLVYLILFTVYRLLITF